MSFVAQVCVTKVGEKMVVCNVHMPLCAFR